jgi:hypothetical protein
MYTNGTDAHTCTRRDYYLPGNVELELTLD